MGARFLTERRIEGYLVEEVRALPLLGGGTMAVRAFTLTWRNYDIVLEHGQLSAAELSELMLFYADSKGLLPGQALGDVLVALRHQANRVIDQKLAILEKRMASRERLLRHFRQAVKRDDPSRAAE